MIWRCSVILAITALVACERHYVSTRTTNDFQFLEIGMKMHDVTNRLGIYDRISGRGIPHFEYDLNDGSEIRIIPQARGLESITNWGVWTVLKGVGPTYLNKLSFLPSPLTTPLVPLRSLRLKPCAYLWFSSRLSTC